MFKVRALAPSDQRLRRRSVESKMPDRWIVVDRFPAGDAGKKRVHQHQFVRFGWELRGVRVGHHQPDVVAPDNRLLDSQSLPEVVNADRRPPPVEAIFRHVLAAASLEVRSKYGE